MARAGTHDAPLAVCEGMSRTIIVAGFGPGISTAVAEKFGAAGFSVALVARNAERLAAGVAALEAKGVRAAAVPADLSKEDDVRAMVVRAREALGPIAALHWNAYGQGAGDVLAGDDAGLHSQLDVAVHGLAAAVGAARADLKEQQGAVLVTNGGFGLLLDEIDAIGVKSRSMGLSIANAAKHKLVRLLVQQLAPDGIFVGEVTVTGLVKGTAWDQGQATLEPATVATAFLELHQARSGNYAKV